MKNLTRTPDDAVTAADRSKNLSKFVHELIEREIERDAKSDLDVIREFTRGPGYPRISRNWRGRVEFYAEREDELLRRYELTCLRDRPRRAGERALAADLLERVTASRARMLSPQSVIE